ncbi:hypothetical protein PAXRUDRAFT_823004 [Paxillus rubicundulus Ve08.2h10]|uniref:Uncharacterized protein n=1 Tax=Paxillus rubicundulus Ve08.2h10 TaxID=930991 RepID=A0A0D0E995_9AGAM|nr:hypothetical protein PAXRUDRAFT_823004 [Paxillus rubicundulus Ve08.2h10]
MQVLQSMTLQGKAKDSISSITHPDTTQAVDLITENDRTDRFATQLIMECNGFWSSLLLAPCVISRCEANDPRERAVVAS